MTELIILGLLQSVLIISAIILPNIIAKYFCTERKIKILKKLCIIDFALIVFSVLILIFFALLFSLLNVFWIELICFSFDVFVILFITLISSIRKAKKLYNCEKEENTINHIMNHLKQNNFLKLKLINDYSNILTGSFIKKVLKKYLWHIELINFEKRIIKLVITDSDLNPIHSQMFVLNHKNYILITSNFFLCL